MQLRVSLIASSLLIASSVSASDDYIHIQYLGYDEDSGRTTIDTPAIEINKNLGADYTLNASFVYDSVSGASPTYYDASSGASATLPPGNSLQSDIVYGDIPYEEERLALAASLTKRFASRDELNIGYSYSDEDDYTSNEVSLEFLHYLDETKNSSITIGGSYQKNDVGIYCFMGNSECDSVSGASGVTKEEDLDVYNLEIGYTRILNKTSVIKGSLFYINEDGYLSNPYMRVVRNYYSNPKITEERKPDTREAYGATIEFSKEINPKVDTIISYRFYDDSWDIMSHTLDVRLYYTWNDKFISGFNLRGYTQTKAEFFSGRRDYFTNEKYASSDRRVSDMDSYNISTTLDYKINADLVLNLGIGYYDQLDYFDSFYYNAGLKYYF
jgi:hypothetical protein